LGALNLNLFRPRSITWEDTQLSKATCHCVGLDSRVQTSTQIVNPDNLANGGGGNKKKEQKREERRKEKIGVNNKRGQTKGGVKKKRTTTGGKSGRKGWGPQQ